MEPVAASCWELSEGEHSCQEVMEDVSFVDGSCSIIFRQRSMLTGAGRQLA